MDVTGLDCLSTYKVKIVKVRVFFIMCETKQYFSSVTPNLLE